MARWEWTQAVALSLDLEPKNVSPEAVQSDEFPLELRKKYLDRLSLVENHVQAGRIGPYSEPPEFLSWAKSNGISYPQELARAVEAAGGQIADWRLRTEELSKEIENLRSEIFALKSASPPTQRDQETERLTPKTRAGRERALVPKEEQSLLKLVLGMAMDKYSYRPGQVKSTATKGIVDGLWKFLIQIDEQTVLDWLRVSADQVTHELHER